jgi:hypothetical protein
MPWRASVLLLLLAFGATPSLAREKDSALQPNVPRKNFSNPHADTDWVVRDFDRATQAAADRDWSTAVRALQEVIDQETSRESPGDAAPYVRPVDEGSAVFEGAWIAARHLVQSWGADALRAYDHEFGGVARAALARAAQRRDRDGLAQVARRWLGLPAGRRAALALVDLAMERGDADAAWTWIEALVDLEAVSGEAGQTLAPWREARIRREAVLIAKDQATQPRVRHALEASDPALETSVDAVPRAWYAPRKPPRTWRTTGGDATRGAVPEALGAKLHLAWFRGPSAEDGLVDTADPERHSNDRPSVWLPPRAVATRHHVLVSDGQYLHVFEIATGNRAVPREAGIFPHQHGTGIGMDSSEDRRIRFGLLEGHALTVQRVASWPHVRPDGTREDLGPGWLVLCAVPDGRPWDWSRDRASGVRPRNDHVQAFHWSGRALTPLWHTGGLAPTSQLNGLAYDTRLYGAPVVYRGLVWVAGVRPAQATQDRWEAWLFALDPHTGQARLRTHIGTGTPMRTGRVDEVIPTSPAAAHGRVIVGTALGMIAAVDARDGRIQWIYRYDRAVETERGQRRNRDHRDDGARSSSFSNEPPIVTGDQVYVTPTDGDDLLVLADRPLTRERRLVCYEENRELRLTGSLMEHVAGVVLPQEGREGSLALVCQGDDGEIPGALVGVYALLDGGQGHRAGQVLRWPLEGPELTSLWQGIGPTGFGAQPYGRALVTGKELFVSQDHGIAVFELLDSGHDGHLLGVLDADDIPEALRKGMQGRPYGNLIPVPGRGLVAVNATSVAFWSR